MIISYNTKHNLSREVQMSIPQSIITVINNTSKTLLGVGSHNLRRKDVHRKFFELIHAIKFNMGMPKGDSPAKIRTWIINMKKTRPEELKFFRDKNNLGTLMLLMEAITDKAFARKSQYKEDETKIKLISEEIERQNIHAQKKLEMLFQSIGNVYIPYYKKQIEETKRRKETASLFWQKNTSEDVKIILRDVLDFDVTSLQKGKSLTEEQKKTVRKFNKAYKSLPVPIRILLNHTDQQLEFKLKKLLGDKNTDINALIKIFSTVTNTAEIIDVKQQEDAKEEKINRTIKGAFEAIKIAIHQKNPEEVTKILNSLTSSQRLKFLNQYKKENIISGLLAIQNTDEKGNALSGEGRVVTYDKEKTRDIVIKKYNKIKLDRLLADPATIARAFLEKSEMEKLTALGFDPKGFLSPRNPVGSILVEMHKILVGKLKEPDDFKLTADEIKAVETSGRGIKKIKEIVLFRRNAGVLEQAKKFITELNKEHFVNDRYLKLFCLGMAKSYLYSPSSSFLEQKREEYLKDERRLRKDESIQEKKDEEAAWLRANANPFTRELKNILPNLHKICKRSSGYKGKFNDLIDDVARQHRNAARGKRVDPSSLKVLEKIASMYGSEKSSIQQYIERAQEILKDPQTENLIEHFDERTLYQLNEKQTDISRDSRWREQQKLNALNPETRENTKTRELLKLTMDITKEKAYGIYGNTYLQELLELKTAVLNETSTPFKRESSDIYHKVHSIEPNRQIADEEISTKIARLKQDALKTINARIYNTPEYKTSYEEALKSRASENFNRFRNIFTTYDSQPSKMKDSKRAYLQGLSEDYSQAKTQDEISEILNRSQKSSISQRFNLAGISIAEFVVKHTQTLVELDQIQTDIIKPLLGSEQDLSKIIQLNDVQKIQIPNIDLGIKNSEEFTEFSDLAAVIEYKRNTLNTNIIGEIGEKVIKKDIGEQTSLLNNSNVYSI